MITSNTTSLLIEQFVDKLLINNKYETFKLFNDNDNDNDNDNNNNSDLLILNTNDEELENKVLFTGNTKSFTTKTRKLMLLNKLLQEMKSLSSTSTINELNDGTYHQQFNNSKSKNLTVKLNRMESKQKFMGSFSEKLMENASLQHLKIENERLNQELDESKGTISRLENDKLNLKKILDLKINKIRQIEEEKGIIIGELRCHWKKYQIIIKY